MQQVNTTMRPVDIARLDALVAYMAKRGYAFSGRNRSHAVRYALELAWRFLDKEGSDDRPKEPETFCLTRGDTGRYPTGFERVAVVGFKYPDADTAPDADQPPTANAPAGD